MNMYQPDGGTVVTIERNEKRIQKAKENIGKMGREDQITLLEGDAADLLKKSMIHLILFCRCGKRAVYCFS